MNRVEQYIRSVLIQKRLLEQHLIEDDDSKKKKKDLEFDPTTGYVYKIPKTTYGDSNLQKLRVHFIDNAAKENGATRGFLVVAIRKDKSKNPTYEQMISAIVDRMRMDKTLNEYYSYSYRIVVSVPKGTDRRKVFAVWIVDTSTETPLGRLLELIKRYLNKTVSRELSLYMKNILSFTSSDDEYSTLVITQPQAIKWTAALKDTMKTIEKDAPNWWEQNFPATKQSTSMLNSVPDFRFMNRINVSTFQTKQPNQVTLGSQHVTPGSAADNFNIDTSFTGIADIGIDPITGYYSLTPLKGKGRFRIPKDCEQNCKYGTFEGEFQRGAYYDGTFTFDIDKNFNKYDKSKFIGTTIIYIQSAYNKTNGRVETEFEFEFDKGSMYYYRDQSDLYAFKYTGTFMGHDTPKNGVYYERNDASSEYTATGELKNGKFIAYEKPVTYPYTDPTTNKIVYTQSADDTRVYTYSIEENKWYVADKADHAKLVNKTMSSQEFISKMTTVDAPGDVDKLIKLFNIDVSKKYGTVRSDIKSFAVYQYEKDKGKFVFKNKGTMTVNDETTKQLEKFEVKDKYTKVKILGKRGEEDIELICWVESSILE